MQKLLQAVCYAFKFFFKKIDITQTKATDPEQFVLENTGPISAWAMHELEVVKVKILERGSGFRFVNLLCTVNNLLSSEARSTTDTELMANVKGLQEICYVSFNFL